MIYDEDKRQAVENTTTTNTDGAAQAQDTTADVNPRWVTDPSILEAQGIHTGRARTRQAGDDGSEQPLAPDGVTAN